MARKAAKPAPKHFEPEDESQDLEEQEALEATPPDEAAHPAPRRGRPPAVAGSMSKAEAIRRVMADGIDNPSEGSQEIRRRFGIEVTPQHFSATKAQMKSRQGAEKSTPGRKPRTASSPTAAATPRPATAGGADILAALKAIKPLVAQMGADKVHEIVDLLG